ncbi:MAG: glycerol-3-phosphate dehydrogenase/oxidase [Candidatus Sumerlaeota bacterium]|nr:glycerol-3-phosphate dehydrogenase/oxidase [Candidatus Sumerlaeota bacterium]
MSSCPFSSRSQAIDALTDGVLDVLIIGGGIVGAGVAREAAMSGLRVGLAEQFDFAFGASSRSSRLLHGGLRYLAQGRLGLVREASREKKIIHRIAPHLAMPARFVFPAYRGAGPPLWELTIGVKLYDLLCGGHNFIPSRRWTAADALQHIPQLRPQELAGAVCYSDALTSDARLVIDTLHSATAHGARVCNYLRVERVERESGVWLAHAEDAHQGRGLRIRARCVINAAGVWADTFSQSRLRLRPTKGVHLVIDHARLPVEDPVVLVEGARILFLIPWGRRVILGTTDTDHRGPLEEVYADPRDVEYILRPVNEYFPRTALGPADVRSAWAGLRPLLANRKGAPSDISRAHKILVGRDGWIDVAGGKLTTYRLMAEQTVDRVYHCLGRRRSASATAVEPLLGDSAASLFSAVIPPDPSLEAVRHYCEQEWALHLDDVMIRRSNWLHYMDDEAAVAQQAAHGMAGVLSWNAAQCDRELQRYRQIADRELPHTSS